MDARDERMPATPPQENRRTLHLHKGMPVVGASGEPLGEIESVLLDEDTGEGRFVAVTGATGRASALLPLEAVLDVSEGRVTVRLAAHRLTDLPPLADDHEPTPDEILRAYHVIGVTPTWTRDGTSER